MPMIDTAYRALLLGSAFVLAIFICIVLCRAILGPRFTDRVVAINIISTKIIVIIAILAYLLDDNGFLDVALIYAMINFLAVVVLSKCYLLPQHKNPIESGYAAHYDTEGGTLENEQGEVRP